MSNLVSNADIRSEFNRLRRLTKVSEDYLVLNGEYWKRYPENCSSCKISCDPRPDAFGCVRCRNLKKRCSKKAEGLVYIVAKRYGVSTTRVIDNVDPADSTPQNDNSYSKHVPVDTEMESYLGTAIDEVATLPTTTDLTEQIAQLKKELNTAKRNGKELKKELLQLRGSHQGEKARRMKAEAEIRAMQRSMAEVENVNRTTRLEKQQLEHTIEELNAKLTSGSMKREDEIKPFVFQKLRDEVIESATFTQSVLAGLAGPLVALKEIDGELKKHSAVKERSKVKMMEREFRKIINEAQELHTSALTALNDSDPDMDMDDES